MRQSVVVAVALCVLAAVGAADECSQYTDCDACVAATSPDCRWVIAFDCTASCVREPWASAPSNNATLRKVYASCPSDPDQQYTCLLRAPLCD